MKANLIVDGVDHTSNHEARREMEILLPHTCLSMSYMWVCQVIANILVF